MKLKKRRKSGRMHGRGMGSHGWGARKKHISSGNQAGFGMSGTGKTAGHRKSYIYRYYGTDYFGKQGFTSRKTERRDNKVMNLSFIENNLESLKKKFGKKDGKEKTEFINLEEYKILGDGEIKSKVIIRAKSASENAKKKIENAGGKLILAEELTDKSKDNKEIKIENK